MSIPEQLTDVSCEWLSQVLGTQVASCQVVDAHSGTTGRGVLEVRYAATTDLPARLFVKLPPTDEMQKLFVISSGMGRREALFYQGLSGEVPLRVPRCYYADTDAMGEHYIMLLEQLEDSGCTFRNASEIYSLDYVRSVLVEFARLHAAYWQSPRLETDLAWLEPPVQHDIAVDLVGSALQQFGAQLGPTFSAMGELYLGETDAIHELWNQGVHTVIHGDVHDGNLLQDGCRPGFFDWALVARGPGMRDVGYFLAGTLTPEDQRDYNRELLTFYREQLELNGVKAPDMTDLWQQYQWHAAYIWVGAAVTLAMGDAWQPSSYTRKTLERVNQTLEVLGSVAAIREQVMR